MEYIYLKGIPRNWHSEKVDLKEYFKTYSSALDNITMHQRTSLKNIMQSMLPDTVKVSNNEMRELNRITNVKQLKEISPEIRDKKLLKHMPKVLANTIRWKALSQKKKKKIGSANKTCNPDTKEQIEELHDIYATETHTLSKEDIASLDELTDVITSVKFKPLSVDQPLNVLNMEAARKKLKYKDSVLTTRQELMLRETSNSTKIDVDRKNTFVVSFRIHEPFRHDEDSKTEHFLQEILLLSNQTLDVLRDKILCQSDFQDVQGDISENPDLAKIRMSRDLYKSAMFYIDNTFYIDKRSGDSVDYSSVIRQWGYTRGIFVGPTVDMHTTLMRELKIRFGYPYLYIHQGSCEHLVIVTDARLLTSKDPLDSSLYPYMTSIPRRTSNYCITCTTAMARWIVVENDRMLHDVSFMCDSCFRLFNYIDGQKVGKFKAYHYLQRSALL